LPVDGAQIGDARRHVATEHAATEHVDGDIVADLQSETSFAVVEYRIMPFIGEAGS
jgi:hypothetical protein